MTAKILIHVGYPKSGSSSLQQNVLSRHDGINYLAGRFFAARLGSDSPEAARAHAFYHEIIHNPDRDMATLRHIWETVFVPRLDPDRLNVVSDERFVMNYRPYADIAADLHSLIGPARILMVVRDQAGLLRSQYDMNPYYQNDPTRAYMRFDAWLARMLADAPDTMAATLRYGDVRDCYAGLFGADGVIVARFERLFHEPAAQGQLAADLGLDPEEMVRLFGAAPVGSYRNSGYRKLTRRLLGRRPASDYLSGRQIAVLRGVLRRLFPGRKTEISEADRAAIARHFAGHLPQDMASGPGAS